jgi:putative ABC transport system ATP-binding protein
MSPMIECNSLTKEYVEAGRTVTVLDNVSLRLEQGEFIALMGPSGSGKSTLLHLCATIEQPTSGSVLINGVEAARQSSRQLAEIRRQSIGVVFQRLNLVPSLTAVENVALPMELDGARRKAARTDALEALRMVGLPGAANRFPDKLSGGEQQRVAVARAVAGNRRAILADEPTAALDTLTGDSIIALLRQLQLDSGIAVMLVTHEPRFASWADRVLFLRDGQLVDSTADQKNWGPTNEDHDDNRFVGAPGSAS